jgi:hypothetical protein
LVKQHLNAAQTTAAGLRVLPETGRAFAAAQAAWRFYHNERVRLPALMEPVIEATRSAVRERSESYALVIHDWSGVHYTDHASKADRAVLYNRHDLGYELQTALVVSDRDGSPLGPVYVGLRSAGCVHSTRRERVLPVRSGLDELGRTINFTSRLGLSRPLVHIADRETDSVLHLRRWARQGHFFVVRADDTRRVMHDGKSRLLSEVLPLVQCERGAETRWRGQPVRHWVGETEVVLTGLAKLRRGTTRRYIRGKPLTVRLVVAEVRTLEGEVLARWLLWTNVPDVTARTIATWYAWRWEIESFHKLLKRGGFQMEHWQQTTAPAVARRLVVAIAACMTVWALAHSQDERAVPVRALLVRLSGRLMKRGVPFTTSALLAGFWNFLALMDVLEEFTVDELRDLRQAALILLNSS